MQRRLLGHCINVKWLCYRLRDAATCHCVLGSVSITLNCNDSEPCNAAGAQFLFLQAMQHDSMLYQCIAIGYMTTSWVKVTGTVLLWVLLCSTTHLQTMQLESYFSVDDPVYRGRRIGALRALSQVFTAFPQMSPLYLDGFASFWIRTSWVSSYS
jgi:hypothetical protein